MPSRPSAVRRRFHTDRVIAKRVNVACGIAHYDLAETVLGRLDGEQF